MASRSCSSPLSGLFVFCLLVFVAGSAHAQQDLTPRLSHIQDDETDRVPRVTAFPDYPSIARRDRIEGEATVCFRIDSRGKVLSAKVKTRTHRIFVKPSLRAIRASSYEPLRANQTLEGSKTCRTYRYRLESIPTDPEVLGVEEEG